MHYISIQFSVYEAGHKFNIIEDFKKDDELDFNIAEFQHECREDTGMIFLDQKIVGEYEIIK